MSPYPIHNATTASSLVQQPFFITDNDIVITRIYSGSIFTKYIVGLPSKFKWYYLYISFFFCQARSITITRVLYNILIRPFWKLSRLKNQLTLVSQHSDFNHILLMLQESSYLQNATSGVTFCGGRAWDRLWVPWAEKRTNGPTANQQEANDCNGNVQPRLILLLQAQGSVPLIQIPNLKHTMTPQRPSSHTPPGPCPSSLPAKSQTPRWKLKTNRWRRYLWAWLCHHRGRRLMQHRKESHESSPRQSRCSSKQMLNMASVWPANRSWRIDRFPWKNYVKKLWNTSL